MKNREKTKKKTKNCYLKFAVDVFIRNISLRKMIKQFFYRTLDLVGVKENQFSIFLAVFLITEKNRKDKTYKRTNLFFV